MIHIENIQNYLINNQLLLGCILIIFFLASYYFSEKMILIFLLIIAIYFISNNISNDIEDSYVKKNNSIIENNRRYKGDVVIHNKIKPIIDELSYYKKYNPLSYKNGMKNIKMFSLLISDIEKDKIYHWRQYIENAENYLSKSINDFQSISISVPEEDYLDILKYNQKKPTKISSNIGELCKKLHLNGTYLLINLSEKLNKQLENEKTINIYHNPINTNMIKESNLYLNNYDLY